MKKTIQVKRNRRLIFCSNGATNDIFYGVEFLNPKTADFFLFIDVDEKTKESIYNNIYDASYKPKNKHEEHVIMTSSLCKLIHALKFYLRLPKLIRKYDTFYFLTPPYFTCLAQPLLMLLGKKVVTICWDGYYEICLEKMWPAPLKLKIMRKLLLPAYWLMNYIGIHYNNRVVCPVTNLRNKFLKWNKNVLLTCPGADLDEIDSAPKKKIADEYITYIGGMIPWRGIDLLAAAFNKIQPEFPNLKLVLMGGILNELKDYSALQKEAEKNKNIMMLGMVPRKQAMSYLKGAKIAITPLRDTPVSRVTCPRKLFEYIAAGVPVLVTDTGDQARIVRQTKTGLVVDIDSDAIADGLRKLLTDKKLYSHFKENCKKHKEWAGYKHQRKPMLAFLKDYQNE